MKRELKFRAWDKSKGQMFLSPSDIRHLGSWFDSHLPGALSVPENIVIMQFTGLNDSYGKDVYEGDIIQIEAFNDEGVFYKYQIHYKPELYSFCGIGFHGEWMSLDELDGCEIIGNIYEY